jgi:hypothetical protein
MAALPAAPVVEASQPVPDEPSSLCAAMSEARTRRTKGSRGIDREAASVESWTFGAGMLAAHRGRTKRGNHHTPALSPSAARSEPIAFGAGILGARSGRAKREKFDRPAFTSSVASGEPVAFGMGMLHARKSRTKTVVAIIVVLAAIAAVCLGPNHRAPSHSTAAAQKS